MHMRGVRTFFDFFGPWILALSLVAGLLYALPPLFIKRAAEAEGRFFVLPNLNHLSDDTLYYLPRAREIYDGHFPSETAFTEYKDVAWFILPPLPQVVTAGFLWLNAGDVGAAVIGLIFVFGVINFLCFYGVGLALLRSRLWAVFLATVSTLTHTALRIPEAFYDKGVALDIVANMIPVLRRPVGELSLVRIDDPLLTMPLYLISFLLLHRFIDRPDTRRALAFGAALGTLTYVYFYYWTTILTIAGIAFLYAWYTSWRAESYASLKPWGVSAGVFCAFFAPHGINFLLFRSLPGAADFIARKGVESGWGLRLSVYPDYLYYAALGAAGFMLLRRRSDAPQPVVSCAFVAISLTAMFLLWNTQLIVGFNMEPFHWWKTFAPLLLVLTAIVVKAIHDRSIRTPWRARMVQVALIVLLIGMGAKKARNVMAFMNPAPEVVRSYSIPASLSGSWKWINDTLPPDALVISHSLISSSQLAVYTHTNPYMAHPVNSLAPTEMLERRFAAAHKIMGASADEMLERVSGPPFVVPDAICPEPCAYDRDRLRDRFEFIYEFYSHELLYAAFHSPRLIFDSITKVSSQKLPSEKMALLKEYYERYEPDWRNFPEHTYLYIGPWEMLLSRGRVPAYSDLQEVFANEDVRIVRVR